MRAYFASIPYKQIKFEKKFSSIFRGLCSYIVVFATNYGRSQHIYDTKTKEKWRS